MCIRWDVSWVEHSRYVLLGKFGWTTNNTDTENLDGKDENHVDEPPPTNPASTSAQDNQHHHRVHLACVLMMSLGFGFLLFWSEGGLAVHFQSGKRVNWRGTW